MFRRSWASAIFVLCLPLGPAKAEDAFKPDAQWQPSYNDMGTTGLLQMPTGRMQDDGAFAVGLSHVYPYYRYFISAQLTPWLETALRYTQIQDRLYGPESFSGDQQYKDRGFDVKVRLLKEGRYTPDLSFGMRDVAGSGLFASEYVVSTRRWYDFDFTAGMAWGNAGTRGNITNPFSLLSARFETRPSAETTTGQVNTDFFRGPAALFGGVEWNTPIKGLRLKLEYDGNSYASDPSGGTIEVASPFNVGVVYAPHEAVELTAAFERGNSLMVRGILRTNFNKEFGVAREDTKAAAVAPAPKPAPVPPAPVPPPPDALAMMKAAGLAEVEVAARPGVIELDGEADKMAADADLTQSALKLARERQARAEDEVRVVARRDGQELAEMRLSVGALQNSAALTGHAFPLSEARWQPIPGGGEASASFLRAQAAKLPTEPAPARPREAKAAVTDQDEVHRLAEVIFADVKAEGMGAVAFGIKDGIATLYFSQSKYRTEAQAIGRVARIVANRAPAEVKQLAIVLQRGGAPVTEVRMMRSDIEHMANMEGSPAEVWAHTTVASAQPIAADMVTNPDLYPAFHWGLSPHLRQHVGGPENFYFFQIYALLTGSVDLAPGLSAGGGIGQNLYNNFENLTLESDSTMPHVRSDVKDYLKGASTWIDTLNARYTRKLNSDLYGGVYGGVLEWMYSGVGGEMLYHRTGSNWGVGLDWNQVWQRDTNGLFGLRDYNIGTGHLSYYQKWPFYGVQTAVRVGRYLAGDVGATFEISRTFENGLTLSAWATKTNVSAAEFGEGSFDKGIGISIPFNLFVGRETTSRGLFAWRPLTRDGGQMVSRPMYLWGMVDGAEEQALSDGWASLAK